MVVLPILTSLFMISLLSAETPTNVPIGIVSFDDSVLSRKLERVIQANPVLDVKIKCPDLNSCEKEMQAGRVQAVLFFPPRMEEKALRLEAPIISVYTNAQSLLISNIVLKELRVTLGDAGASFSDYNLEDLLFVEVESVGNPEGNYVGFLGINLIVAVFHLCAMLIGTYLASWPFRTKRVSLWIQGASGSRIMAIFGAVAPGIFIVWLEFLVLYFYTHTFFAPIHLSQVWLIALGQWMMVVACFGMGMVFVGATGSMRVASSLTGIIGGPAFAFAGQTFPLLAMPLCVQCFAYILPLTPLLQLQSALLLGPVGLLAAWDSFLLLSGMAAFWLILGTLSLYWQMGRQHD